MTSALWTDSTAALHDIDSAVRRAQATGRPWALCDALNSAGRSYRTLGALAPALSMFEQALRWSRVTGSADQTVDVLCELCETHASQVEALDPRDALSRRQARDRARDCAIEAASLARHASDARWEVTVLLRVSDLLDRLGEHDEAAELQAQALEQMPQEPCAPQAATSDTAPRHGPLH